MAEYKTSPFAEKLYKIIGLAERVLLAAAIIALLLNRFEKGNGAQLLTLSLGSLAAIYFLRAYKPQSYAEEKPADGDPKFGMFDLVLQTIAPKVGWIGCSVTTLGILFYLQAMKGQEQILLLGGGTLAIVNVMLGIAFLKGNKLVSQLLMRTVPLCLMALYLLSKVFSF
ncbi:MAG: hypothetical protein JSU09_07880 [Bacteroidetes bacterium]|nr:hypothetical protein [Bacteroidota bacterium]